MFCTKCGAKLSKNAKFCKECGLESENIDNTVLTGEVLEQGSDLAVDDIPPKFGGFLMALISTTSPIILVFNIAGWIIAAVWLIVIGEWSVLFTALFVAFISVFVLSFFLLLDVPIALLAGWLAERKKTSLALAVGSLGLIWATILEGAWVVIIFSGALSIGQASGKDILPFLLLGYGLAAGPFQYMASKEGDDAIASYLGVWFVCVSYILAIILYYLGLIAWVLPLMLILAALTIIFCLRYASYLTKHEETWS